MKRRFVLVLVALLVSVVAQAQYFTGFSVESYRIASAWPTSFRSVRGSVQATIGNTGLTRSMSGVTATVYRNGRRFAEGVCEDVTISKGIASYTFKGNVRLSDGVSTWDAIKAAFSFNANEYTLDFTVTITYPDGHSDHVVRRGMPLVHYLHRR